ncbi:hypothetical protein Ccrd_009870 [Cynara cardunculus var. scolymus]|uniref:Myc-type, basic helix-loop-helix (BHLH) domain-containing protein n=1 Tax=Cynara cardunculus var. scolymus TaxID=59895 RepID=A0A103YMD2_CYNCS|nr:hypothetical protein Ccrd_009870 [Cynara cardunculus var. scolymus]
MSLQDDTNSFDPTVTHDDFLDQMLSGLQTTVSWPDISAGNGGGGQNKSPLLPWDVDHFDDQSAFLSSKLRQHQISAAAGGRTPSSALKSLQLSRGAGESGLFGNDNIDDSSFKSPAQNFGSPGTATAVMNQVQTSAGGGGGGVPSQPRQRVRARRGQATDPHSIAERVKHKHLTAGEDCGEDESSTGTGPECQQGKRFTTINSGRRWMREMGLVAREVLSMSRLGGAAAGAIAPVVAEGSGVGRSSNGTASSSNNDTMTVTENQVVKLMEEDMGSAMQYLQGKGLCLMPISLATAISTATCNPSSASRSNLPSLGGGGEGGGPSSPNMSVLTVQSANGVSVKDSP